MKFDRKALIAFSLWAAASIVTPSFAQAPQPAAPDKSTTAPKRAATPSAPLLDINSASEDELRALKGIGDKRAADIIKNRPYKGKDELVQKKIIPAAVYAGIKDKIIAKQN
ncbi:helix-hairpin-helix domain-containing protein [Methylocapsa polymorpha]|uniref:Helix-hairpin-helix domain-containing protein n=1 Tax=Methylocapsa polymorpha TaxID=3080828 RepID=A0ABZ0HN91_9HYPH|nr:helix-hairpin-helix domain-containing protein [Methylocapsa sp. RX1]